MSELSPIKNITNAIIGNPEVIGNNTQATIILRIKEKVGINAFACLISCFIENAGKRELYEETGVRAGEMIKIGTFYPLHSLNTETITVFYTIINSTDPNTLGEDAGEKIVEQEYFSFSEALEMIDNGEITDGMTANVIQIVIRKLQKNLSPSLK